MGIFAALKAGGVFVVINASTKLDKLRYMLNNCRAAALMLPGRQTAVAHKLLDACPSLRQIILTGKGAEQADEDDRFWAFTAIQTEQPSAPLPRQNIDRDLAC
ncbi:AMP-binding protein, partial [Arthrospira platensis SPKY2]